MYLKEIKMVGFKSFAEKTNIEFDRGITGIVGPNGSGKSNIVDAVRWVLGEQSIKSLRGDDSMTDIIFSGSKSRNPLNMASVTLVFDNSDGHLPTSYEEVAIKKICELVLRKEKDFQIEKFNEKIAIMMSCKLAIKANEKISIKEMEQLIEDLRNCQNPYTCPHGRPTIISYSRYELEKLFKRAV